MTSAARGRRRGGRARPAWLVLVPLVVLALLAVTGAGWWWSRRAPGPTATTTAAGPRVLGGSPSGGTWWSGAWTGGGDMSASSAADFGRWRGRPLDVALTYPERSSFAKIAQSSWHISTFDGFRGRLVYGLPLLPQESGEGSLAEVAQGRYDWVWTQVASDLVAHGRGDAVVRVGWEANGDWYRWGATARTAADYRAAFRHVVTVMRAKAPHLVFDFDVACGTGLRGSSDRAAALTALYPGDDVVDVVGCDVYDSWKTRAADERQWQQAVRPADAVGLADVVDLAAAHGKELAVPEWGLWTSSDHGGGDNPFYVTRMHRFFEEHADRLAYEAYFDETEDYIRSSIWAGRSQNPRSAAAYGSLWSKHPSSE